MFRLVERNFWSLNALAVQPGYAFWREAIRHLAERSLAAGGAELARMRAASCAAAGVLLFVVAALVAGARLAGDALDRLGRRPRRRRTG